MAHQARTEGINRGVGSRGGSSIAGTLGEGPPGRSCRRRYGIEMLMQGEAGKKYPACPRPAPGLPQACPRLSGLLGRTQRHRSQAKQYRLLVGSAFHGPEKGREEWRVALGTVQVRGYAERGRHVATFSRVAPKDLCTASACLAGSSSLRRVCVAGIQAERIADTEVPRQG